MRATLPQQKTLLPQADSDSEFAADVVLSVCDVSKKFCRNLKRSMLYGVKDLTHNLIGAKQDTANLRKDEFWALDHVAFELRKGDTLGIIGANGSGKTTLLRLLTGIFPPDAGEIRIKGRIGALVAVGAGFHPHMTGRENIYLNGTILGMHREEIREKFDQIVDFAEIGDFLDAPVSTYSSGMRVRLGFAIAVHCEPDILLVDEVLSVGDLGFRNKSLRRMNEFREKANALIFVSHNLEQVRELCNRVIILDKGRIVYSGSTHAGCATYEEVSRELRVHGLKNNSGLSDDVRIKRRYSSGNDIDLLDFGLIDARHQKIDRINMKDPLIMFWAFRVKKPISNIYFSFGVANEATIPCFIVKSNDNNKIQFPALQEGDYKLIIEILEHHLLPGIYFPQLSIRNPVTGETYERIWSNIPFHIVTDGIALERGIVAVDEQWTLTAI